MEKIESRDGTTIGFDQLGHGPAVILVAGAACDRGVGAPIAGALAEHFTVLNYDRRGRGDSGDTPPYAVTREVEDLAALLDAAGGSASVLGLSSGAALAAEAAASGLPIDRLLMWEPPFSLDPNGPRHGPSRPCPQASPVPSGGLDPHSPGQAVPPHSGSSTQADHHFAIRAVHVQEDQPGLPERCPGLSMRTAPNCPERHQRSLARSAPRSWTCGPGSPTAGPPT